ncbi:hypothetical protein FJV71_26050, partial [Salmonella enterica subsp. enterica serovar Typhimurium]|uniref:AAA family ATPase n=1 Tax=Salmonella enterica TaxID=28901 RepID=UPI0011275BDD
ILIDEPEISLHPNWQISFLENLTQILNQEDIKSHVIIATHSAHIVSSAQNKKTTLIKAEKKEDNRVDFNLVNYSPESWSVENILYNIFNVRTNRNYYTASDMQTVINHISGEEKNLNKAKEALARLREIEILDK